MLDPAVLPAFVLATSVVTVAPGPDNTYISAVAVQHGPAAGLLSAVGMAAGMCVHVAATAVGLAAILTSHPWSLTGIKLLGGLYLGSIAWSTFADLRSRSAGASVVPPAREVLRRAVVTNLTNPKVILFFVSFLPQFTRPEAGSLPAQLLVLGAIFLGVGLVCDATIGLTVGLLGRKAGSRTSVGTVLGVLAGTTYAVLAGVLLHDVIRTVFAA